MPSEPVDAVLRFAPEKFVRESEPLLNREGIIAWD
jgi:hypothetical protein